ncbi:type II toxin-antitoxin system RelE/ParE family toxin [Muricauda sp. SCSIO 64092]|uniref:type II toxin-antitoxin system RelE/ParE family toxin n=1 Tax=Allomuricauda sp. SCSIO 64092 TaxID=2908842 RepID=UPI001FF128E1|nr:type II toxin-antitoxin system RelE/ParE family toxin [Muricauda sp. SCSIO 64092]UOY04989.1 type II toxin-antitoxin system RelE/ParE family toxin [Muricauda sp. SCSIO 64092]
MAYRLEVRDDALDDIARSYKWYEEKSEGLGLRFVDEVEATINYVSKYPEHFQIKSKKPYREAVLKVFPYVVVYEINKKEKSIVVYSVFPCKDDPDKKPR